MLERDAGFKGEIEKIDSEFSAKGLNPSWPELVLAVLDVVAKHYPSVQPEEVSSEFRQAARLRTA